jgi:biotin transport system permease protein
LALWVSRLVVMTTPAPVLIDALIQATRPLARFGFKPERFGLAVLVMLRSIPYLAGSFEQAGQAVQARGLRGLWGSRATQVVVRAVAYAVRTGDAMAARGLGD